MAKFKVNLAGNGRGEIFIDGKDISNYCVGLNLSAGVGKRASLILDLSGNIEIEGDADICLIFPGGDKFKVQSSL